MAIDYSGSGQYHSAATAAVTGAPATFSCWLWPDNTTGSYVALGVGRSGATGNYMGIGPYGSIASDPAAFEVAGSGNGFGFSNGFTNSAWQHFAGVTASSTNRYAWLNGVRGAQHLSTLTPTSLNTTDLGTLTVNSPIAPFAGLMAEAAIWDVALSDDEMASLAKGISARRIRPQSLKFYAPMVRAVQDLRGGLTLTETGSPAVVAHPRTYR